MPTSEPRPASPVKENERRYDTSRASCSPPRAMRWRDGRHNLSKTPASRPPVWRESSFFCGMPFFASNALARNHILLFCSTLAIFFMTPPNVQARTSKHRKHTAFAVGFAAILACSCRGPCGSGARIFECASRFARGRRGADQSGLLRTSSDRGVGSSPGTDRGRHRRSAGTAHTRGLSVSTSNRKRRAGSGLGRRL